MKNKIPEETEIVSVKKKKSRHTSETKFTLDRKKIVDTYLNYSPPFVDRAIFALETYKMLNELDIFMRETEYFVFEWALKNVNVQLVDALFKNMKRNNKILMIRWNEFDFIKKFISSILKLSTDEYEKNFENINSILTKLMSISSGVHQVINKILEKEFKISENMDKKNKLKEDFEKIYQCLLEEINFTTEKSRVRFFDQKIKNEENISSDAPLKHPVPTHQ